MPGDGAERAARRRRPALLAAGAVAPEIGLSTPYDIEVSLRALLAESCVVVEFIRGTWDPNARARLAELARAKAALAERGGRSLVVTCERPATARAYLEAVAHPLRLVVDSQRLASKAYGVHDRFSFGAFDLARPATFIADRCSYIRFAHRGRSPIDFAPLDAILGVLDAIAAESPPAAARSRDLRGPV